jgi:tRNA(Ile)-lysidine synthase
MKAVIEFADKYGMLKPGSFVLCAVSGGADSMCLLDILRELSAKRGFRLAVLHFNHKLRGKNADADEDFVRNYCERENIEAVFGTNDVAGYAKAEGIGTEEAARALRYRFFEETARRLGADNVATAHNADDNAETVLMNLSRGSGLKGLCGIPPVRGIYIRPLLALSRAEIEDYLRARGLPHIVDETNFDPAFTRNRLRMNVIPELKRIYPAFLRSVTHNSEMLRQDEEYLCKEAEQALLESAADSGCALSVPELIRLNESVSSRVIRKMAEEFGLSLTSRQTAAVLALARSKYPSGRLSLPNGIFAVREYSSIRFIKREDKAGTFQAVRLRDGEWIKIRELGLEFLMGYTIWPEKINTSFNTFFFKKDKICGNIVVRPRLTGDTFKIDGRSGTKTVKKLFIELKIPVGKRSLTPLICDDAKVLAIPGVGTGSGLKPEDGDRTVFVALKPLSRFDGQPE